MTDPIQSGIQAFLDASGDGWSIARYIVFMGIERLRDGELEETSWQYYPPGQPDYINTGLVDECSSALIFDDEDLP